MAGGADAPRTLLAPFQVELLNVCCAATNLAFDSWIFLMARRVFLLRAADGGGPEAAVISTSGSLPMGAAASLPGSPLGRGVGD